MSVSGLADGKKQKGKAAEKMREIRPDGEHFCQNSDMQRGSPAVRGFRLSPPLPANLQTQKLEVKRGTYGLGAFAVELIRKDEFIGGTVFSLNLYQHGRGLFTFNLEYIGELVPTADDGRE